MACLTTGLSINCDTQQCCAGGIETIYLGNPDEIDTITYSVDNEVDGITMLLTNTFFEVQVLPETSSFTEVTATTNGCCPAVTQTLNIVIKCRSTESRNFVQTLLDCCCGLVVIHQESGGARWMWGDVEFRRAYTVSSNGETGTALEDANTETIVLTAKSTIKARRLEDPLTIPV